MDRLYSKYVLLVGDLKRAYDKDAIQVRHPIEFFKDPIW